MIGERVNVSEIYNSATVCRTIIEIKCVFDSIGSLLHIIVL